MIPLYGFVQGDVLGLLVLADERDTIEEVARKLLASAELRAAPPAVFRLLHAGRELPLTWTVAAARLEALDRIDVVAVAG